MSVDLVTGQSASNQGDVQGLTATLPAAPTAGHLLWLAAGADKNVVAWTTPAGFTALIEHASASVSFGIWWKVSDGTEQAVATDASGAGKVGTVFYGEYDDAAVPGSTWQISASATNPTAEVSASSWSTGTTAAITAAGRALAAWAVDSINSAGAGTYTNGYAERFTSTGTGSPGWGGLWVAEKLEPAGGTTECTRTGGSDQWSAAVAVFTKVAEGGGSTPATVNAPAALATATAPAPGVAGGSTAIPATIVAPAAVATATAPDGIVQTQVTVYAPAATANATAPAPTVAGGSAGTPATVGAPAASATATAPAPSVVAGTRIPATVTAPAARAAATAPIPTVTGGTTGAALIEPPAATATATAPVPVVSAGSSIPASVNPPAATATASAAAPDIRGRASVGAPPATGTAIANVPALAAAARVQALAALAMATAPVPGVFTTSGRDVTFLGFTEHTRDVTFGDHQRQVTFTEHQRQITMGETMRLHPQGVEYYDPDPQTDPPLTGWEASFDGTTWVTATAHPDTGRPVWLVAGPDADPGTATVLTATVDPIVRAVDNPEVVVRGAPRITVSEY